MTGGSLFDRDLSEWTWDELDGFLNQRIRENGQIEYKAVFNDQFEDTLISMANAEGGFVFVGIKENDKRPTSWPELPAGKYLSESAYSRVASSTTPKVPIEARGIEKPDGSGQVVVVKVLRGLNPPYFAPGRGVRVRVGDGDVHADPRMLELLFARRTAVTSTRKAMRERLAQHTLKHPDKMPTFYFLVAPLGMALEAQFSDESSGTIRTLVRRYLDRVGFDPVEVRGDNHIDFEGGAPDVVRVTEFGEVSQRLGLPHRKDDNTLLPLDLTIFFQHCYYSLAFGDRVLARVFGARGDLYVGVHAEHLEGRELDWPGRGSGPRRSAPTKPLDTWTWDTIRHSIGDDPVIASRDIAKALAWRCGYSGYEDLVDQWGASMTWNPT